MSTAMIDAGLAPRRSPLLRTRPRVRVTRELLRSRCVHALSVLVVGAVAWLLFAPVQLGGSVTYVITDGVSMLPRFRTGDLVLLRTEGSYHVGEVAGYRDAQMGGVTVMHRIIAIDDGHYVFRGDNNRFTDPYRPTRNQIVGAEWIHLPAWGNVLMNLRAPVTGAIIVGLLGLFVLWPRSDTRRRRRRHRHAG